MEEQYYWWQTVYPPFSPGENNLPHLGEVIKHYMQLSGLTKRQVADMLGCGVRNVEKLTSEKNVNEPVGFSRRVVLAGIINAPAVLFGILPITVGNSGPGSPMAMVSEQEMRHYEHMLAMCWELYYTSSVQRVKDIVDENIALLNDAAQRTEDFRRDQYDAMRCRYFQLYAQLWRDLGDSAQSLACENMAVDIALRLMNVELLAASLQRRARVYMRDGLYEQAWESAREALRYGDLSRDPIKGKCYQIAGEITGYMANGQPTMQQQSLEYFDKAAYIALHGDHRPDGSFFKTDIPSIYIEKAEILIRFGRYRDALSTLGSARRRLPAEQNRWKVNLLLAEATAYAAQRKIGPASYAIKESYDLITSMNLPKKKERLQALYQQLQSMDPKHESVLELQGLFVK